MMTDDYNKKNTGCSTLRAGPSCHVLEGYIVLYVDPTKFDPNVVRDAALTAIDWAMVQGAFDSKSNANSNNKKKDDTTTVHVQVRPFPDTVHQDARASFAGHDKTLRDDGDESPSSTSTSANSNSNIASDNSSFVPVIWLLVGFMALATPILALLIYTKQQALSMNQQQRHDILPNFPLDDIDEDDDDDKNDDEDMNDHLVFATGRRPTSVRNLHNDNNNNSTNSMGNSYIFTHSFT
eukprot:scaffold196126_cov54-Attheya_sp.AAC.3